MQASYSHANLHAYPAGFVNLKLGSPPACVHKGQKPLFPEGGLLKSAANSLDRRDMQWHAWLLCLFGLLPLSRRY